MLGRYFRAAIELQLFPSERRLRRSLRAVFQDRPLRGENVLDIGGGRGLLSMYAGAAGARRVVCLEPEADGSMSGSMSNAETFRRHLGVENVEIVRHTLQEYEPGPMKFDVIVLHKSINHLDEEACIRMLEDASAWGAYRAIAARIANLASQGATLIVCDCGRSNLFSLLGLWNPLAPSIEWHKHQNPPTWIRPVRRGRFRRSERSLDHLDGTWRRGAGAHDQSDRRVSHDESFPSVDAVQARLEPGHYAGKGADRFLAVLVPEWNVSR